MLGGYLKILPMFFIVMPGMISRALYPGESWAPSWRWVRLGQAGAAQLFTRTYSGMLTSVGQTYASKCPFKILLWS